MDKGKKIIISMVLSLLVKGGGLCISLLLFPVYLNFFKNNAILGIWFSILSVVSWILTFDFGFGNGLRNYYVKYTIEGNDLKKKKLISTTYIASIIMSLVLGFFSYMLISTTNWNDFFNISSEDIDLDSLRIVMLYTLCGILLQFFLKIIISILQAEQMSAIANILGLMSNVILLVVIPILPNSSDIDNLICFSKLYLLASNLPLIVTSLIMFSRKLANYRPNIRYFDSNFLSDIMKLGVGFFWLQIVAMILFNTNNILITWFTGSENVVYYQTYYKLFNLIGSFAWISLVPIWSAVTEAYEEKNFSFMKKMYRKLMIVIVVTVISNIILIIFLQPIVDIWLGRASFYVDYRYSIVFGIYNILYVWWGIEASFSNGTGKIKTQLIFASFGAFINIPLAYFFTALFNHWIGVLIANIIAMFLYCIAETFHMKKIFNKLGG